VAQRRDFVQHSAGFALRRIAPASLLFAALPAFACETGLTGEGVHTLEGSVYTVYWQPLPAALRVSEFFAVAVVACAKSNSTAPDQMRIDAVMPEHKHGMNYRPSVTALGDGRFRAEGLLLHMPGTWEFSFDVRGTAGNEVLRERMSMR
jgi:hypothetical protein